MSGTRASAIRVSQFTLAVRPWIGPAISDKTGMSFFSSAPVQFAMNGTSKVPMWPVT